MTFEDDMHKAYEDFKSKPQNITKEWTVALSDNRGNTNMSSDEKKKVSSDADVAYLQNTRNAVDNYSKKLELIRQKYYPIQEQEQPSPVQVTPLKNREKLGGVGKRRGNELQHFLDELLNDKCERPAIKDEMVFAKDLNDELPFNNIAKDLNDALDNKDYANFDSILVKLIGICNTNGWTNEAGIWNVISNNKEQIRISDSDAVSAKGLAGITISSMHGKTNKTPLLGRIFDLHENLSVVIGFNLSDILISACCASFISKHRWQDVAEQSESLATNLRNTGKLSYLSFILSDIAAEAKKQPKTIEPEKDEFLADIVELVIAVYKESRITSRIPYVKKELEQRSKKASAYKASAYKKAAAELDKIKSFGTDEEFKIARLATRKVVEYVMAASDPEVTGLSKQGEKLHGEKLQGEKKSCLEDFVHGLLDPRVKEPKEAVATGITTTAFESQQETEDLQDRHDAEVARAYEIFKTAVDVQNIFITQNGFISENGFNVTPFLFDNDNKNIKYLADNALSSITTIYHEIIGQLRTRDNSSEIAALQQTIAALQQTIGQLNAFNNTNIRHASDQFAKAIAEQNAIIKKTKFAVAPVSFDAKNTDIKTLVYQTLPSITSKYKEIIEKGSTESFDVKNRDVKVLVHQVLPSVTNQILVEIENTSDNDKKNAMFEELKNKLKWIDAQIPVGG